MMEVSKNSEANIDSNNYIYNNDPYRRISSGYFHLIKFNQNLYDSCQLKFSKYISIKKDDIKLMIDNKVNHKIPLNEYIAKIYNNNSNAKELTPIPYINKRKINNNLEQNDLKNFQRNVVLMRRLEYSNKIKEKKITQKYRNQIPKINKIKKIVKGFMVRKIIKQVNIIKETLDIFFNLINECILKKYFHFFINSIPNNFIGKNKNFYKIHPSKDIEIDDKNIIIENNNIKNTENEFNENCNANNMIYNYNNYNKNDMTGKINNKKKNIPKNISSPIMQKERQNDSIIENDEYIEIKDIKKDSKGNSNELKYILSCLSSYDDNRRAKTEIIQRQYRKHLKIKGYYGKFDVRKIAIIYLLKNIVIYNIKSYVLGIMKSNYKEIVDTSLTQEENYGDLTSERYKIINDIYLSAKNQIK